MATDVARALTRLGAALEARGVEKPRAPTDSGAALALLEAEIAPLLLPEEMRWFWQTVDPSGLRVQFLEVYSGLDFALWGWQQARDEFFQGQPPTLLTFAYGSHDCLSIELAERPRASAPVYAWNLVYGGFDPVSATFADHLASVCDAVESDAAEVASGYVVFGYHNFATFRQGPPVDLPYVERDQRLWPDRWLRPLGLCRDDAHIRGATHTLDHLPDPVPGTGVVRVHCRVSGASDPASPDARIMLGDPRASVAFPMRPYANTFMLSSLDNHEVDLQAIDGAWRVTCVRPLRPAS